VFSNVTAGYHKVTVMDKNGCSPSLSENVIAINYPKYFTPNGDNINDVWTIKGLSNLKNVEMTVFDRSGKAIAALTPSSLGWDGKFNGADLPSDDYWFVIHFVENNVPRTFRSHFSLKR
jgi:gliding motility-associated-like protein